MNLNKIGLIICLSFCIRIASAQPGSNSLLWEISGNGLSQSSYLFGTIHLLDEKDFIVRSEIDSVFNLSELIAFEIKMDDLSALSKMQAWFPLPEGKTLKDYCTPEEFEKIKNYFRDSLGTDIAQYENQKPFGLSQLQIGTYIDGDVASFELYFLTKSIMTQKPVKGLELIEDQLHIFDVIPYEEQIDWLVDAIDSSGVYDNTWFQLIDAYKNEDLNKLWKLFIETSPEFSKYEDILITGRNKNWIPIIKDLMNAAPTFIAVGAAHLPGDFGVLELLAKEGYTVKAL